MKETPQPPDSRGDTVESHPAASLLAHLEPRRWAGDYLFNSVPDIADINPAEHVAIVREAEGWTLITEKSVARHQGLPNHGTYTAITLQVKSALTDVGLTAAVSRTLAEAGIACNIVAGFHHDHLFIPVAQSDRALTLLSELQRANCPTQPPTHRP